jgi:hypothetical protein
MIRQSVYSRLAGYEDTNDADRLRVDPAMRRVVGVRATEKTAASTSQVGRFETRVLTEPDNLAQLMDLSGCWIDQVRRRKRMPEVILDLDSSVSPTHGQQEGTAYNGHFECTSYHPLFCFNQFGDLERALLREGQVHSADNWRSGLEPVIARYRQTKNGTGQEVGRLGAVGSNTDPTILPAPYRDWILGDTYVLDGFQHLFLYHRPSDKFVPLARLKGTAAKRGIHRVDLHARTSRDGRLVCIDATHEGLGRQMHIVDIGYILDNPPST